MLPFDLTLQADLAVRMLIAAILGAAIGLEREIHEHPAGMRTHLLVSLGSAIFTILSIHGFGGLAGQAPVDPTRIAAQIVSGIGFLGAGAILKYGTSIRGLTTAASLWTAAGEDNLLRNVPERWVDGVTQFEKLKIAGGQKPALGFRYCTW